MVLLRCRAGQWTEKQSRGGDAGKETEHILGQQYRRRQRSETAQPEDGGAIERWSSRAKQMRRRETPAMAPGLAARVSVTGTTATSPSREQKRRQVDEARLGKRGSRYIAILFAAQQAGVAR